jgi:hypothetical protein
VGEQVNVDRRLSHPWLYEPWEFRQATEKGAHTMPHVEELEYLGYIKIAKDMRYGSWLMGRPCQNTA